MQDIAAPVHMLPLTPLTERYSVGVPRRVGSVPPRLSVEATEDGRMLNDLMSRAEHQFHDGSHKKHTGTHGGVPGGGMISIMRTAMLKQARRLVMRDGDPALVHTRESLGTCWSPRPLMRRKL